MRRHAKSESRNLCLFFLVAFAFTWFFWIFEVLALQGLLGSSIIVDFLLSQYNPAAWGPLVSAVLLTWWNEGRTEVIRLLKRALDYRFGKVWWIPILLIFPMIYGIALLLAILGGDSIPELFWASKPFVIVPYFFTVLLLS